VWCKADKGHCKGKLNGISKELYETQDWFQAHVNSIYKVCKNLDAVEKNNFQKAFAQNNRIEELCNGSIKPIDLGTLNADLLKEIRPFFNKLYTKFLGWKKIRDTYGDKKKYYDELNFENCFTDCPCCGYGDLKTYNSKGHSPYDHYLPQKHYPFSVVNFNNLFPICHTCNSDGKGETDIIKDGQVVFYPFSNNHPNIQLKVTVDKSAISKLIKKTETLSDKLDKSDIQINFNPDNDARVVSWAKIFKIKSRYFSKIADNRISWIGDVREVYRDTDNNIDTVLSAFDKVIKSDANKSLGFLKSPYLESLKAYNPLVKAIIEVSGDYKIN
jgi:hypothetical protein